VTIDRVIKVTNRRVNALEFVVIPAIEDTIKWIEGELDELDREDFYRLKCVQDKKLEAKQIAAEELKQKMALQAKLRGDTGDSKEDTEKQEQIDIL
jgi:V-type H+-transporting ATPase subunit D